MPTTVKCPGCGATLRLRDDLAGKRVKCPKCQGVLTVPAAEEPIEVEPELEVEAITTEPAPRKSRRPVRDEEDEERPRRRRRRDDDPDRPRYKPCPQCGGEEARRVKWTPWGSFYGPALFTHVRCEECGYKYNGRSGRSNTIPAIIFVTVPLLGILGILGFIGYVVARSMGWIGT
jgi:C4-type Zn-finger protein